jgi:hypothetical protein
MQAPEVATQVELAQVNA